MSTLIDLEHHLTHALALVEELQAQPSGLDLIDAQIEALQQRRAALTGWLPTRAAHWVIAREVARHRDVEGSWGWGQAATEKWMRGLVPVPVTEMAEVLSDNWRHVIGLVEQWDDTTPKQRQAYYAAVRAVRGEDRTAWDRASRAVLVYSRPAGAFVDYGGDGYVAAALARRSDLTTPEQRDHYERLTRAWRQQGWTVHPEDHVEESR